MSVGFKLRPGTTSRAYNLVTPGEVMDLNAHPYEPGLTQDQINEAFSRRYGHAIQYPDDINPNTGKPVFQLPDFYGPHVTDYESALNGIWSMNPRWFADNNLGEATGNGLATEEERRDAQAANVFGQMVLEEYYRLNKQGGTTPPPPIDPPPPPPPPPVDPPPVVPPPPVVTPVPEEIQNYVADLAEQADFFVEKYRGVVVMGPGRRARFGANKQLADAVRVWVDGLKGVVEK